MANINIYDTNGNVVGKLQNGTDRNAIIMYIKPDTYPAPLIGKVVVGQHITGTWILITIVATEVDGNMLRTLGKYAGNAINFKPKLLSVVESTIQDVQHTFETLIPDLSLPSGTSGGLNLPLIGILTGGGILALLLLRGGSHGGR